MLNPKKLKAARQSAGMTQGQAAARLGVSQSRIAQYESGKDRNPTTARLQAFARLYRVTLAELVD